MGLLILVLNCAAFFLTVDFTAAYKCRRIDTTYLPACANVGYNFTANFSDVGQKSYQEYVSSELTIFTDRFNSCSPLSKFVVCSRYVPKCSEGVEGPALPCREVCEQFVDDCDIKLKDSGLYKSYVAYCRLLKSKQETSKNCLKPDGFISRPTKDTRLPSCEAVTRPACLENNLSGLENTTRTRLQASLNRLEPVLNTSCSENLKKFACFVETAPCLTSDGSTLHACQTLCEEVRLKCGEEFKRHNIFFPQCIPNYPETDAGNGLCHLSHWPAPWPRPTKLKHNPETTPRSPPKVITKAKRGQDQTRTDPDANKETKKELAGGVLAAAVVGFLIVISVMALLLHLAVKKIKNNVAARRQRMETKYVNDSNISSNGKAVTIGSKNKGFEDEICRSESALY